MTSAATFGLTLDRKHRPIELSVAATGTLAGGASLPLPALRALRASAGGFSGSLKGRRWEANARLDLRDPLVAAAWGQFRDDPTSGAAIGALGAAIRDRAALDVRTYGVRRNVGRRQRRSLRGRRVARRVRAHRRPQSS